MHNVRLGVRNGRKGVEGWEWEAGSGPKELEEEKGGKVISKLFLG